MANATTRESDEFRRLLKGACSDLDPEAQERVVRFREAVCLGNTHQNLTRNTEPLDFLEGHVIDVRELLYLDLKFPCMDFGSGAGVPGLLAAVIDPTQSWVLAESEKKKALFLERTIRELGLKSVAVFPGRGEDFLRENPIPTVVSRAVAPLLKIHKWIRKCSTWNNLVLLKSRKWEDEWKEFGQSDVGGELEIKNIHEYVVGDQEKRRVIVQLARTTK